MTDEEEFRLHPAAAQDILDIWEYTAANSIPAAGMVRTGIHDAIRTLVASPHIGHRRSDPTSRPIRFWRVWDYLIAYAPDERPLWVIAVFHGRRNPRVLAAILRARDSDEDAT